MSFANDTASTPFGKLDIAAPTSIQAFARSD